MKICTDTAPRFFLSCVAACLVCLLPAWSLADDASRENVPSAAELAFLVGDSAPINPDDPNAMGDAYFYGRMVPQDYQEAIKWFKLSAEQGYAQAQYNLGLMYSRGEGVDPDRQEALKWYRLSAEQGIAGAQCNLGLMYEKGHGVEQDYVEAHKWFNIAGVNGNDIGRKNMDIVEKKMTPSQIIASVALAKGWMEKL